MNGFDLPECFYGIVFLGKTVYAMGSKLETLRPDVIVIVNPHGFRTQRDRPI